MLQQNVISKNIAETVARWIKEGGVNDLQRLISCLIEKSVVRCCLERDENGRAAGLHADDSSLVDAFLKCTHLLGEMDQCDSDLTGLLALISRSQKNDAKLPMKSDHLATLEKLVSAYGGSSDVEGLNSALGGSYVATCRFEASSAPSSEAVFPDNNSLKMEGARHYRCHSLDLKKLAEALSSGNATPGVYFLCFVSVFSSFRRGECDCRFACDAQSTNFSDPTCFG